MWNMYWVNNIVEAHCYALQCTRIECERLRTYVAVSINNWLQDVSATEAFIRCVQCFVHSWRRSSWPKRPAISYWLMLLCNCSQSIHLHTWVIMKFLSMPFSYCFSLWILLVAICEECVMRIYTYSTGRPIAGYCWTTCVCVQGMCV